MSTLFVFISVSFATTPDIPATTTTVSCNDSAINTNNAPANLEINWEANTINLRWYSNNTLIQNVPAVSSSCEYDSTLTPPATIPTRTGYTFTGWRVRPQYNFATLTTNQNGTQRWARGYSSGDKKEVCLYRVGTSTS